MYLIFNIASINSVKTFENIRLRLVRNTTKLLPYDWYEVKYLCKTYCVKPVPLAPRKFGKAKIGMSEAILVYPVRIWKQKYSVLRAVALEIFALFKGL